MLQLIILRYVRSFILVIPVFGGNNCLHGKSRYKVEKSTLITIFTKPKFQLRRQTNNFQSICFPIGRVFSIFRQKLYGTNQSEMDIKKLFPAPTQNVWEKKTKQERLCNIGKYKNNEQKFSKNKNFILTDYHRNFMLQKGEKSCAVNVNDYGRWRTSWKLWENQERS